MDFIPNTEEDRKLMLKDIKLKNISDLFKDIPSKLLLKENLKIPKGLSEIELKKLVVEISEKNKVNFSYFLGAGAYKHFIPSVVGHITGRSEFYTAYTPYQPEISQAILQAIYEYQTMICELMGMDAANASTYDGASALAESCIMATNITKRNQILISKAVHPDYRQVIKTYCEAHNFELVEVGHEDGIISVDELKSKMSEKTAAFLVQNPCPFMDSVSAQQPTTNSSSGCLSSLGVSPSKPTTRTKSNPKNPLSFELDSSKVSFK